MCGHVLLQHGFKYDTKRRQMYNVRHYYRPVRLGLTFSTFHISTVPSAEHEARRSPDGANLQA